ncbi:MAG: hypothetical protein K5694_00330 [Bacilli bacterium]|nr:hypothetical protein [Bacilli bacterium]
MPICRYCHKEIPKEDKDVCRYCGGINPIESDYKTQDITGIINKIEGEDLPVAKSRRLTVILTIVGGWLGLGFFYLGYKKQGLIAILATIIIVAGGGTGLFFLTNMNYWMYLAVLAFAIIVHIPFAIRYAKDETAKDAQGEFIR